ncbi:MAG TPA: hypothetical protein PLU46_00160 [Thiotrichales bacterium]|nr:hypothetical protein [Gammaproteobacteria bacterium]HQT03378.1 hypothetical protein [Thiotrichales bacterium]
MTLLTQKPRIHIQAVEKVMNRHTAMRCPESRLVVAMIAKAMHDCWYAPSKVEMKSALRFLLGTDMEIWAEKVGLEPSFVRFIGRKAGYLPETAQWIEEICHA